METLRQEMETLMATFGHKDFEWFLNGPSEDRGEVICGQCGAAGMIRLGEPVSAEHIHFGSLPPMTSCAEAQAEDRAMAAVITETLESRSREPWAWD